MALISQRHYAGVIKTHQPAERDASSFKVKESLYTGLQAGWKPKFHNKLGTRRQSRRQVRVRGAVLSCLIMKVASAFLNLEGVVLFELYAGYRSQHLIARKHIAAG